MPTDKAMYELLNIGQECWQTAEDLGWHEKTVTFEGVTALLHSEVSEAFEEYRNGEPLEHIYYRDREGNPTPEAWDRDGNPNKTEGVAAELADVFIRLCDHGLELGIPWPEAVLHKMKYNKTRSHRHGGKLL